MTIKETIKKAIKGGYNNNPNLTALEHYIFKNGELKWQIFLYDPLFWQALGKAMGWTGEKIRMCVGCGVALKWNEKTTMNGKHDGKNGCGSDIIEYEGQWLIEWHKFVDHLAENKTVKNFFKTLK